MLKSLVAIFIGGGLGASLRYLITLISKNILGLSLLGTFVANMIGCLVIGYIFGITLQKIELLPNTIKLFLIVGVLGGLTTFSTFSLEIFELIKSAKFLLALSYLFLSIIIGIALTTLGFYLSKSI